MATTAIPKNCACETIHRGAVDEYVDQDLCPLHGDGAACFVCGTPLMMTQDEVGYMEDDRGDTDYDRPLGMACEDCGQGLDADSREAEHLADVADEFEARWLTA